MKPPSRPVTLGLFLITVLLLLIRTTQARKGCGAFGHSCYGGHGKRTDPDSLQRFPKFLENLDDNGDDTEEVTSFLREFCSIEPQYYFRLAPVLRKLLATSLRRSEAIGQ